jgi:putative oxidoreductase
MTHVVAASGPGSRVSMDRIAAFRLWLVPIGRTLFAALFIAAGLGHFSASTIAYAGYRGVPFPNLAVPMSGLIAFAGGVSILLGYRARLGAWLIVLFLVPVTLKMHRFWTVADPTMAMLEQVMFMKNVSMLGAALIIAHFGAGPISLDGHPSSRTAS